MQKHLLAIAVTTAISSAAMAQEANYVLPGLSKSECSTVEGGTWKKGECRIPDPTPISQSEYDTVVSEVSQLQTDLDTVVSEVSQLQTDLDTVVSEVSQLQTDLDAEQTRNAQLQTDLDAEQIRNTILQGNVDELSTDVIYWQGQYEDALASTEVTVAQMAEDAQGIYDKLEQNFQLGLGECELSYESQYDEYPVNGTSYSPVGDYSSVTRVSIACFDGASGELYYSEHLERMGLINYGEAKVAIRQNNNSFEPPTIVVDHNYELNAQNEWHSRVTLHTADWEKTTVEVFRGYQSLVPTLYDYGHEDDTVYSFGSVDDKVFSSADNSFAGSLLYNCLKYRTNGRPIIGRNWLIPPGGTGPQGSLFTLWQNELVLSPAFNYNQEQMQYRLNQDEYFWMMDVVSELQFEGTLYCPAGGIRLAQ